MLTLEYIRQFRVFGYALFDLGVSFLGVYLLAPLLTKLFLMFGVKISRKSWLLLTLPLSIAIHLLVGTMTQMTRDFFDIQGHYVIKILIIGLLILGTRGITFKVKRK